MFNDNANEQNFARLKLIIPEVSYINKKKPPIHKLLPLIHSVNLIQKVTH